ncbi:helix-turn-helix domain-containing protein [Levilactobacillus zymae]|uniref:helix-turn-helix domain-containing protein n=1 Tax=Levilactobacillus zymae TaxID=267363 RepID=UPI0028B682C2|nr:helix-turn-helix domain-containing protein [Levilactobacillus zymae]MDT6980575.1 helix-turn-helix domain-containing protein [Levilactobacillus zymae]
MKKTFFNPETETTGDYTEVWQYEVVPIKDVKDLLVRTHYWQDADGELWLDFNDPNENFRSIFTAYRARKGYLQPQQIKTLRHQLGLSVREFARRLGLSYAKLSQIENNKRIQTLSQEISFRKAQQDYQQQGFLTAYPAPQDPGTLLTQALSARSIENLKPRRQTYMTHELGRTNYFEIGKLSGGMA